MSRTWLAATLFAVGCGNTPSGATHTDATSTTPPDGPNSSPMDAPAPTASDKIKHIVVVVKENHTFDNYFGSFPGADGIAQITTNHGVIAPPRAPDRTPRDLCHAHSCALADLAGGAMNGWDSVAGASQNGDDLTYAQYTEADIPNYWQYARHFALADRFFANVLGPSFPGHTFVLAAQAGWATGPDILPPGVDWKFYGSNFYVLPEIWSMFDAVNGVRNGPGWANIVKETNFETDIDNGTLPAVSFLVNQDLDSEHPNVGSVCSGENWTVGRLNRLMASDYWKDTAVLFTMDDFGGWYDHVPPPRAYGCNPAGPYGLGFRLPLIVISPYSKKGVYHEVAEQASIPRFIETVFKTPTLSSMDPAAQDGQANDLTGMFDFTQEPLLPLILGTRTCH